jgi:hypothetical protein
MLLGPPRGHQNWQRNTMIAWMVVGGARSISTNTLSLYGLRSPDQRGRILSEMIQLLAQQSGRRPSTAARNSLGARKASMMVMLT